MSGREIYAAYLLVKPKFEKRVAATVKQGLRSGGANVLHRTRQDNGNGWRDKKLRWIKRGRSCKSEQERKKGPEEGNCLHVSSLSCCACNSLEGKWLDLLAVAWICWQ